MNPSKDEVAATLARVHYESDPSMQRIYRLKGDDDLEARPDEPIKLLEVNEDTIPSGIQPLYFGPTAESGPSILVHVVADLSI